MFKSVLSQKQSAFFQKVRCVLSHSSLSWPFQPYLLKEVIWLCKNTWSPDETNIVYPFNKAKHCWIYTQSCMLSHSSLTWPVQRSGLKEVIERNKANLDFPAVIFCHWTKPEKLEDRKTSEVSKFGGVGKSCFFFFCKALERLIGWL